MRRCVVRAEDVTLERPDRARGDVTRREHLVAEWSVGVSE